MNIFQLVPSGCFSMLAQFGGGGIRGGLAGTYHHSKLLAVPIQDTWDHVEHLPVGFIGLLFHHASPIWGRGYSRGLAGTYHHSKSLAMPIQDTWDHDEHFPVGFIGLLFHLC